MQVGAEQRRSEVLHMNEVDGPLFKIKGEDPRVTRVGSFLRKTSIDELPQLWNVFKGEMSLVGPRPFVVYEADLITGWASRRLDMTPGITGLLAGARAERHPVRGDDEARLPLRDQLVALVGSEDPLPDDPGRARPPRRLLAWGVTRGVTRSTCRDAESVRTSSVTEMSVRSCSCTNPLALRACVASGSAAYMSQASSLPSRER